MVFSKEDQKRSDKSFRERRKARINIILPLTKICTKCGLEKSSNNFGIDKITKDGLRYWCKECEKLSNDEWKIKNWHVKLLHSSKSTAKKYNMSFDLDKDFILSLWETQGGKCYWLKIDLIPSSGSRELSSPSLDRLDCSKGYTKDNIVLSSQFANLGRCDTDAIIFRKFCDDLLKKII